MSDIRTERVSHDHSPGDEPARGQEIAEGVIGYLVGIVLAVLLTAVSFFVSQTTLAEGSDAG